MSLSMLFMLMSAAVSQSSVYATSNILGPRQVTCMQNVQPSMHMGSAEAL